MPILATLRANIAATIFGGMAALFAIIAVVQTVNLDGFLWIDGARDKLETAKVNLRECRKGREDDRNAYQQAQKDAAAKNQAEVQRIESEQEKHNAASERDTIARLNELRRQLRGQNAAPQGASGRPGASAVPAPTANPDGKAGVCLEAEQLLRAAENEERHDQLIRWVEQQLSVKR